MQETDENQKNQEPTEGDEKNRDGKPESTEAGEGGEQAGGGEVSPEADSKKEEISGYNEHPDQAKVGGG